MAGSNGVIMVPFRGKGEPNLPPRGILAVNPSDLRWLEDLARREHLKRHFLFHSNLYTSNEIFLAGPAVGAPMAVMCLEKLIALGARNIVLYGWCGSLTPQLAVQDVLVPTGALSEEGTSVHYPVTQALAADETMAAGVAQCLRGNGVAVKRGPVWTTDAPYRETVDKVERYGRQGILGVDMEFSALCAAALFRGVTLSAVMLVSDELWRTPWRPAYGGKKFRNCSGGLLESVFRCLVERKF